MNPVEPKIYSRKDHTVSRNDIDPDALKIMYRLIRHGYRAYLVGGGVRDLLLNKPPKDFDIATDATPRKIKNLFRNCRIIGRRFKLAHIYFKNNKIIEVSTFRDSSDTQEENPNEDETSSAIKRDNTFGTEETDAIRRDLTINGLFYDLSTFSVIDYVGGMEDLQNKVIRIIGDPKTRFLEDPVRMIRAVRHAARSGFNLENTCKKAIEENHDLITEVPQVRVYEEIKKDLSSGSSLGILQLLSGSNLLGHLLPELEVNGGQLLSSESFFSQVLRNIDESMQTKEEATVTPILATLSLFMTSYPDTITDLHKLFEDKDDITDHVASCFIKLAVPRKERERIEDLLKLWHRVLHTPLDKLKKSHLERRQRIDDLFYLLRWLGGEEHFPEEVDLVSVARKRRLSQSKKRTGKSKRQGKRRPQSGGKDRSPQKKRRHLL